MFTGELWLSSSGIYEESNCNPNNLSHAVLLVGYGSEGGQDYWIIKNRSGKTGQTVSDCGWWSHVRSIPSAAIRKVFLLTLGVFFFLVGGPAGGKAATCASFEMATTRAASPVTPCTRSCDPGASPSASVSVMRLVSKRSRRSTLRKRSLSLGPQFVLLLSGM